MERTGRAVENRAARTGLVLAIALAVSLLLAVASSPGRALAQDGRADDAGRRAGSSAPTFEAPRNPPRYAPDRVIVGLERGVGEKALEDPKDETGAKESFEINGGRVEVLTLPESSGTSAVEAVQAFSESPGIAYAERDAILRVSNVPLPNDPRFGSLYGLHNTGKDFGFVADADVDAPEAWTVGKGAGATVAVIDSGMDVSHEDLKNNLWTNPDEVPANGVDDDQNGFVDDVHGWDFVNNNASVFDADEHPHGTAVSGAVAATTNNAVGVAGSAPEARMASLKVMGPNGMGFASHTAAGIDYAVSEGMPISNNSYGSTGFNSATMDAAIERADAAGHLFVVAAGNGGTDAVGDDNDVTPFYPASLPFPNIVSVAATDQADALAGFSNYGATGVDIAAPGVKVHSTIPGNAYSVFSGTSVAAPHVAGAAAMVLSMRLKAGEVVSAETDTQIKEKLMSTVDVIPSVQGKVASNGRLNAAAAVGYDGPPVDATPPAVSLTAPAAGVAVAGVVTISAEASDERGVSRVDFYVGTQKVGSDDTAGGSGGNGYSFEWDSTTVSDGGKSVTARAYDAAGNETVSGSRTVYVRNDATAPSVSLTAPAEGDVVSGPAVALSADASDDTGVVLVQFYVDGVYRGRDSTAPYAYGWNSETVADGRHSVTARAFDAANNQKTSAARSIVANNSFPETSLSGGPAEGSPTRSTDATFGLASTDGDAFRCQLDGGAVEPCSSPKGYADLGQGGHTFRAWAIGSAGEAADTDQTPATRRWSVDSVGPSGTVKVNGGAATTRSLKVKLALQAADPAPASGVARMRLSNDGKSWSGWQAYATSKAWKLKSGPSGARTVFVQYQDGAGNVSAAARDTIRYRR